MKALFTLLLCFVIWVAGAQDSTIGKPARHHTEPTAYEQLLRMNHTSNMMIGGGVGLCGVSVFLIYYGVTTYNAGPEPNSTNPNGDIRLNHKQGIAFLASAVAAIGGGAALITLGAMKKYHFKVRKRAMGIKAGLTPNGQLLIALNF